MTLKLGLANLLIYYRKVDLNADSNEFSFMLAYFTNLGVTQKRTVNYTKKQKMINRTLVQHARAGASLAFTKRVANVEPPPPLCIESICNEIDVAQNPCLDRSTGGKDSSYTQENQCIVVGIKSNKELHGIHGYEGKENNVSKVELGQGCDPGVRSAPFVNSEEGVCFTHVRNVVAIYANAGCKSTYQRISKDSGVTANQMVRNNIAYLENARIENCFLFETDSSPSGDTVKVYDVCAKGVCS